MEFKYIMMNDGTRDIPFIFPKMVAHINMYGAMRSLPENMERSVFWTIVSAGFVNLISCECYGESESLKEECPDEYKSRPEMDTLIVMLYQWQHGVFEPIMAQELLALLRSKS
jgi:hypothetical protein